MKVKNLFLISFFFLISPSCFASSKRITEEDRENFFSSIPIYDENKNSSDLEKKRLSEYTANLFAQYFALANKIGGAEMVATLKVIYNEEKYSTTANELIERGETEARRQGIHPIYLI